ncbi:hypothetical protein HPP92_014660 [Vanilla planifolia]|uniref:Uncharacterized protein n=1 Tax=Vanilla planifolia TaxID=51239 RepID=A0A835QRZ0_VANPL|nr:hypothetical protein HPP92_014660 [Vanilla planifolia]
MTEKCWDAGKVADRSDVHPNCKYAHNPYHKCNHLCFDNRTVMDYADEVMKTKEPNSTGSAGRRVNPECKNASNPYHVCAEYCFQGIPERAKPGHGTKQEKPKESGNIMSNADERRLNPNCRHASNPYHKCAEYCFQNVPEDIPHAVPNKGVKGSPRIERRGEYPSKERSMESEHAEASTSSNDGDDSLKIINKNVGTDESEPVLTTKEKEMELSVLELSDTQPLRIDAIDLFKEWAKYCSLKASEEDEAKQGITRQRI